MKSTECGVPIGMWLGGKDMCNHYMALKILVAIQSWETQVRIFCPQALCSLQHISTICNKMTHMFSRSTPSTYFSTLDYIWLEIAPLKKALKSHNHFLFAGEYHSPRICMHDWCTLLIPRQQAIRFAWYAFKGPQA